MPDPALNPLRLGSQLSQLGKLALYQLSYVRMLKFLIPEPF